MDASLEWTEPWGASAKKTRQPSGQCLACRQNFLLGTKKYRFKLSPSEGSLEPGFYAVGTSASNYWTTGLCHARSQVAKTETTQR